MASAVATTHIWVDDHGRAWIDDTNVKVLEVVLDHLAYGWSPEETHMQHPGLSLAQIYAAIGYYYDHRSEFDREIEGSLSRSDATVASTQDSPVRRRLRALGRL